MGTVILQTNDFVDIEASLTFEDSGKQRLSSKSRHMIRLDVSEKSFAAVVLCDAGFLALIL